jgi:hypothetical protein
LKSLVAGGMQVSWTDTQNNAGTSDYRSDGTILLRTAGRRLQGRYRINGNQFCATYAEFFQGAERCGRWYKSADRQYQVFSRTRELVTTLTATP